MVEYFWEYDYKFGQFLKKFFPNTYQRKYSLTGNGIYNLIRVNGKIYDVQLSNPSKLLEDNGQMTTDELKNKIINNIVKNMRNKCNINKGEIYFKLDQFNAKIKVVRKMTEPQ